MRKTLLQSRSSSTWTSVTWPKWNRSRKTPSMPKPQMLHMPKSPITHSLTFSLSSVASCAWSGTWWPCLWAFGITDRFRTVWSHASIKCETLKAEITSKTNKNSRQKWRSLRRVRKRIASRAVAQSEKTRIRQERSLRRLLPVSLTWSKSLNDSATSMRLWKDCWRSNSAWS